MSDPRVLIASASAGSGHVRAGDALLTAFRSAGAAADHVDVLQLAPAWVRAAYARGFELIASRAPRVWREIYERSDGPDCDTARWGEPASRLLFRGFLALLVAGRYDACVCTHFLPGQLAAGRAGLPLFTTVVTDFELHRYWVNQRVHNYFVASRPMADALRHRLPGAAVTVSGIPTATPEYRAGDRREARVSLGLNPERGVVLVMGGGFGLGVEESARAVLRAQMPGLQLLVVCGRNTSAQRRLDAYAASLTTPATASGPIRVAGYVSDIARYMTAADLVITKPGGLTTSEALALNRPLLLTRGMPGHEEANVRYLASATAALPAPTDEAVSDAVRRFFGDDGVRRSLEAGAARVAAPHAAAQIAETVLGRASLVGSGLAAVA
jgi:processive 1,2-diacylglycerol beta-glucosyltransferase